MLDAAGATGRVEAAARVADGWLVGAEAAGGVGWDGALRGWAGAFVRGRW